jgi:hypothetical protein
MVWGGAGTFSLVSTKAKEKGPQYFVFSAVTKLLATKLFLL